MARFSEAEIEAVKDLGDFAMLVGHVPDKTDPAFEDDAVKAFFGCMGATAKDVPRTLAAVGTKAITEALNQWRPGGVAPTLIQQGKVILFITAVSQATGLDEQEKLLRDKEVLAKQLEELEEVKEKEHQGRDTLLQQK